MYGSIKSLLFIGLLLLVANTSAQVSVSLYGNVKDNLGESDAYDLEKSLINEYQQRDKLCLVLVALKIVFGSIQQ